MIDLTQLREHPDQIIAQLAKKDPSFDGKRLYELDQQMRTIKLDVEELRSKKNELAKAAQKGVTPEIRTASKKISAQLKEKETELSTIEEQFQKLYLAAPNVPQSDVPTGGKESNKVVKTVGKQPPFSFEPKHHVELGEALGWFDFQTASKLAGTGFALYKNDAVKLMYALPMFMLKNNMQHGYAPVLPSVLVNEQSLTVTGNFPKFKDDVYALEKDNLYLTPTAEVNLTNMYRDHIFEQKDLPVRATAWTSCFRREAGNYGAHERGLIRIHQFEKVELVTICEPHNSAQELDRMIASAESILQKLGLHYRISLLAAQDMSFASAKTYDIEVWLPGQKQYYEVSSASNCTDFQARRGLIRYRSDKDKKTHLVHTLNGSSLALPRLVVAIMETYQQADGSIAIPEVLKHEGIF
jgi:seryl-tRNA synthetase